MTIDPIILDWLQFAARWLHVITAIAWIGSSFYFIALDLGLRKPGDLADGADGEEWQVHGGGFYHIQKYLVAPARLPEHLTWFKWESYWTWMSGFILMCLTYYMSTEIYLIDANKVDMPAWAGIAISVASLVLGWFAYDLVCKSRFGDDNTRLMIALYIVLVALAWGFTQIFTGRAAFLHVGAITATWMSANVFLVIIPNQKIVVEDLKAGRKPDARYGQIAKQRSTHNNYLTLPVIFFMLSNHYPLSFATEFNWVIAALVLLMGVTIRHYFNSMHARKGKPMWTWAATVALFVAIIYLSTFAPSAPPEEEESSSIKLTPAEVKLTKAASFEDVSNIVLGRCAMCHATEPGWEGIVRPPKGVLLETPEQVVRQARDIYLQSARSHAMPPANVSFMEPAERKLIAAWYENTKR